MNRYCLLAGAFSLLLGLSVDARATASQDRRNVLLIVCDDLNCRVGSYGDPLVRTPNIDRLAGRGVLFERAYAQYPVCNPSRCSFLSGRRPESTGILDNTVGIRTQCPDVVTLPQCLREAGWFTAGIAKIFHVDQWDPPRPEDRPGSWRRDDPLAWDYRFNTKPTETGRRGDRMELAGKSFPGDTLNFRLMADGTDDDQDDGQTTLEVIKLLRQTHEKPFFIGAGYRRPHAAWIAPRAYFGPYPVDRLSLPDPGSRQGMPPLAFSNAEPNYGVPDEMLHLMQGYVASVSFLDAQVGRLLDELDRLELADSTLIVLFGDHGFHLGEHGLWHKHTLFEESTRTPLIIAGPGIPAGRRCSRTVELLDVFPTVVDLCGVERPAKLEGASLRPLLEDSAATWDRAAFTVERRNWKGRPVVGRSIRTERWRYTEWDEGREGHELYDHRADPHEHRNLADIPEMAGVAQELAARLRAGK
ncbi:MAG TPA: sulfatase [Thermoguttaceae bacterium]|nr:sulfatase [Thermoguttaceae bacterium]